MNFTIVSLGNVEFLSMVLNGVAMICGTGNWTQLVAVGFVIGLLFIGFQTIFNGGQQINLHHTLLCFICYLCMFGPQCTVVVEDAYTGAARTVDNLPLGVGVAGAGISGIGYGVTRLMEQGYAAFDRTSEHQFAEPLRILNNLRSAITDDVFVAVDAQLGARANGAPSDSRQALINYLSECIGPKIQLGGTTPTRLYKAGWTSGEFQFASEAHMTQLTISGVAGDGTVTCNAAYGALDPIWQALGSSPVQVTINRVLHLRSDDGTTVAQDATKIENAMQALNATMNGAQDLMRTLLIENVYDSAAMKYYRTNQDTAAAIAVNQALIQRNTQWASEGTMFLSTSRALMAFFEGFVYAITPIMGFLIAVGAFGVSLVVKYFLVIAWIQLWLPIMSITNLYIMTGARSAMTDASLGAEASFYAADSLWTNTQTWVSTGGMLMAATPMIALFLISGSTYAFTALTGRLGGQDHFNERIQTPDAVQPSAVMSHAAAFQANRTSGVLQTGMQSVLGEINLGGTASASVRYSEGLVNGQARTLIGAAAETAGSLLSNAHTRQMCIQTADQWLSSKVDGEMTGYQLMQQHAETAELLKTEEGRAQIGAALMSVDAEGRVGADLLKTTTKTDKNGVERPKLTPMGMILGKMGFSFDVSASAGGKVAATGTANDQIGQGKGHGESASRSAAAQKNKTLLASLNKAKSAAFQNMSSETFTNAASATKGTNVSLAFSDMADAKKTLENAKAFQGSVGFNQKIDFATAVHQLTGTAAGNMLANLGSSTSGVHMSTAEQEKLVQDTKKFARIFGASGMDKTSAQMHAQVAAGTLFLGSHLDNGALQAKFVNAVGQSNLPTYQASPIDVNDHAPLKGPGNVDRYIHNAEEAARKEREAVKSKDPGALDFGEKVQEVKLDHNDGTKEVEGQAKTNEGKAMHKARQKALAAIMVGPKDGWSSRMATLMNGQGSLADYLNSWSESGPKIFAPEKMSQMLGSTFNNANQNGMAVEGFTRAQTRMVSALSQRMNGAQNDEELQAAGAELRDEMRRVTFGKKLEDMTPQEVQLLDRRTGAMVDKMQHMLQKETIGAGSDILNFNTAYGLTGGVSQVLSREIKAAQGQDQPAAPLSSKPAPQRAEPQVPEKKISDEVIKEWTEKME